MVLDIKSNIRCPICQDTGWVWARSPLCLGTTPNEMMPVPQFCLACDTGRQMAQDFFQPSICQQELLEHHKEPVE